MTSELQQRIINLLRTRGSRLLNLADIRERLDHHLLNEIKGLEQPTLENLARYIFTALKQPLRELTAVTVRRDSLGEACTYRGTS